MAKLTPQERRLADVIKELKDRALRRLPAGDERVFDGVLDFLEDVRDFAKDSRVRGGLTTIGTADRRRVPHARAASCAAARPARRSPTSPTPPPSVIRRLRRPMSCASSSAC